MTETHRSRVVVVAVLVLVAGSGCLTLNPGMDLTTQNSTVFHDVSSSGEWANGRLVGTLSLTPNATTDQGVSQINVVAADGETFYTTAVDSGQSNVSIMTPTNGTATIVAVNTVNGTVVETRNATITGDTVI